MGEVMPQSPATWAWCPRVALRCGREVAEQLPPFLRAHCLQVNLGQVVRLLLWRAALHVWEGALDALRFISANIA